MKIRTLLLLSIIAFVSCITEKEKVTTIDIDEYWGENPWPEIRKKRINTLLPNALQEANVDCWLIICRENNNDPLADHIGGENAGGTAVFLFYNDATGFHSKVFSPSGEATALDELDIHDEVVSVARGTSSVKMAVDFIKNKNFKTIAVNSSDPMMMIRASSTHIIRDVSLMGMMRLIITLICLIACIRHSPVTLSASKKGVSHGITWKIQRF